MRVRGGLGEGVLAAAEADFQPEFGGAGGEGGAGVGGVVEAQAGECFGQQLALAGAERLPPLAAVEAIRRGLEGGEAQRLKADFSAGTRSVFSQVKVPSVGSGSRPKWP